MKIVLLGYMGSGKSTIGRLLARDLNLTFIDLDRYIEDKEHDKITTLFRERGEIYFRKKEHEYLNRLLNQKEDFVLATGGGTPCYANNMTLITSITDASFYLHLSVNGLVDRLIKEKSERPLIKNIPDADLPEFIGKHLFERTFFYMKAHYKITLDTKNTAEILEEIKANLINY